MKSTINERKTEKNGRELTVTLEFFKCDKNSTMKYKPLRLILKMDRITSKLSINPTQIEITITLQRIRSSVVLISSKMG